MLNHLIAGLWPYLRAQVERTIRDQFREKMSLGVLSLTLERASLGAILPIMAQCEAAGPRCRPPRPLPGRVGHWPRALAAARERHSPARSG